MHLKKILIIIISLTWSLFLEAKLKVITTTTNLKNIVQEIGQEHVEVFSLSKGTQDPHYLEAKPSFMFKAKNADLFVSMGLNLEVGWLPLVIRGARNPKIRKGQNGYFEAAEYITPLEQKDREVSRSEGDVHPDGNPHFLLDPENAILVSEKLSHRLSLLAPQNKADFEKNTKQFVSKLKDQLIKWKIRVPKNKKVITYHKTLTYFFHRFQVQNIAILEPKPGIPPSASHILNVMKKAKTQGVQLTLVENFFNPTVARRVAKSVDGLKVQLVPVAVGGESDINNLFDLYEKLIKTLEN